MAKTIALIASLDTKKKETLYAASVIQKQGFSTYIIDISTKNLVDGADTGGNIKTLRDRVGRF